MAAELPLFPLRTVLFPGGPLRLRIFEARYLDMVGRCLRTQTDFGVVGIRDGSEVGAAEPYSVGTTARIVDWDQGGDGLLGLAVTGQRRFELTALERAADGLYLGKVEPRPAETPVRLRADEAWAREMVHAALADAAKDADTVEAQLEDAGWLSWRIAEMLPLTLEAKQELLELDDARDRLGVLRERADAFKTTKRAP